MSNGWFVNTAITIVFLVLGGAVMKWLGSRSDSRVLQTIGEVKGLDVDIVMDEDRDFVGLTFHSDESFVRVLMSAQEARMLAEWLRIAGSKGKTVMQARVNYRRAQTSKTHAQEASPQT